MSAHRADLPVLNTFIPFHLVLVRIKAVQPSPQGGSLNVVLSVHGLLRVQGGGFGPRTRLVHVNSFLQSWLGNRVCLWYFSHLKYFYLK